MDKDYLVLLVDLATKDVAELRISTYVYEQLLKVRNLKVIVKAEHDLADELCID